MTKHDILLNYEGKKSENEILQNTPKVSLKSVFGEGFSNKLIFGDNLFVLKTLLEDYHLGKKVDLIYIDPPFATNGEFRMSAGRANTISSARNDEIAYSDRMVGKDFLEFLRARLIFLRELMSDQASIYLHIDTKMGHYVKVIMDEVFGRDNFRNDITRIKCNPKNFYRKAFGNTKDLILFYTKSKSPTWNDIRSPLSTTDLERLFTKFDPKGRRYTTIPLHAPGETTNGNTGQPWHGKKPPMGRHWRSDPRLLEEWDKQGLVEWSSNGVPRKKIYADESAGKKMQDIWDFKDPQYPSYPTEKNIDLLKFIIESSSNRNDTVMDCFCGSGTTLVAAEELGRKWIGIDESEQAIKITKERLANMDSLLGKTKYEFLIAEEVTVNEAHYQANYTLRELQSAVTNAWRGSSPNEEIRLQREKQTL